MGKLDADRMMELLRALIRGEISVDGYDYLERNSVTASRDVYYDFTLEDMATLLRNFNEERVPEEELPRWEQLVMWDLWRAYKDEIEDELAEYDTVLEYPYPRTDAIMAYYVFYALRDAIFSIDYNVLKKSIDFEVIIEDIERFKNNEPIRMYLWTRSASYYALMHLNDMDLKIFSEELKEDLRNLVLEFAGEGRKEALVCLGYACYGGNELFRCDWEKSRDCFLQLMDNDEADDHEKCHYANTLGYIYYYGRCTGGVPEYDKAFQQFTLGAIGGIYESMYKLADMYLHGYGVPKNIHAATNQIVRVYNENLLLTQRCIYDSKFADAALRMGNLCRDGYLYDDEYYYYTLADYAIRKRLPLDDYGDLNVYSGIQKELSRIRETIPLRNELTISTDNPPEIIRRLFEDNSCFIAVKPLKGGFRLSVQRIPKPGKDNVDWIFECYPEYGYCNMIFEVSVRVMADSISRELEEEVCLIADSFEADYDGEGYICKFMRFAHNTPELSFHAKKFTRRLPNKKKKELAACQFASVTFTPGGRAYDYICEIPGIEVGDKVFVFANGEEKEVEVTQVFKMNIADIPMAMEKYNKIIRKA